MLAAPVDTEELVAAEALWIAVRAGTYGCVPMVVAMCFGLDPSWGVLAWFNPLYHLVELVGHAVFGWDGAADPAHLGVLVVFGFITWRIAVAGMTRKLIT